VGQPMRIEDFAGHDPALDPESFFLGETRAWGVVEDLFGRPKRRFVADVTGTVDGGGTASGGTLVLDERFLNDDGTTDHRVWRLIRSGPGRWRGTAPDVVGPAHGRTFGNAFVWRYTLEVPAGRSRMRVDMEDRMVLQPGGVLLDRAVVRKWGVPLATVTIAFVKPGTDLAAPLTGPRPAGG